MVTPAELLTLALLAAFGVVGVGALLLFVAIF